MLRGVVQFMATLLLHSYRLRLRAIATPAPSAAAGEDDGFLLVYVYEAAADASFLHVYNAQTMDSKPLAVVSAPHCFRICKILLDHTEMHQLSLQSNLVQSGGGESCCNNQPAALLSKHCAYLLSTCIARYWGQGGPLPSMHVC
jgi:hypothetical protein